MATKKPECKHDLAPDRLMAVPDCLVPPIHELVRLHARGWHITGFGADTVGKGREFKILLYRGD